MARKKSSIILPDDNFRIRNFRIELYEDQKKDNEKGLNNFDDTFFYILQNYDDSPRSQFLGIYHDKDSWSAKDYEEKQEYMDSRGIKVGDLKKPHYHFVVKFKEPRYRNTIAKELGIETRFILPCNDIKGAEDYCIHLNQPDKYLYDVNECFGSLKLDLIKRVNGTILEENRSDLILDLIMSHKSWNLYDFTREINKKGLYSTFRQGFSLYRSIIEEHNLGII